MNKKKKKTHIRKNNSVFRKIFNVPKHLVKHWEFMVGLIIGLIPFVFTVTPINDIIHPLTINPSTVTPYSYDTISYFDVTNNRNTTLYAVQVQVDIPEGLTGDDITVDKLTRTENIIAEIPAGNGSIIWDTSIMLIGGNDDKHHFIIMQLDRVLPGESNILSFSIRVKASKVTSPIRLSIVKYSEQPNKIFSGP